MNPKVGDYVLATKYSDGDPGDQWAIGFVKQILDYRSGDRYDVVDNHGQSFRANGFRKSRKISKLRGHLILERYKFDGQQVWDVAYWDHRRTVWHWYWCSISELQADM